MATPKKPRKPTKPRKLTKPRKPTNATATPDQLQTLYLALFGMPRTFGGADKSDISNPATITTFWHFQHVLHNCNLATSGVVGQLNAIAANISHINGLTLDSNQWTALQSIVTTEIYASLSPWDLNFKPPPGPKDLQKPIHIMVW